MTSLFSVPNPQHHPLFHGQKGPKHRKNTVSITLRVEECRESRVIVRKLGKVSYNRDLWMITHMDPAVVCLVDHPLPLETKYRRKSRLTWRTWAKLHLCKGKGLYWRMTWQNRRRDISGYFDVSSCTGRRDVALTYILINSQRRWYMTDVSAMGTQNRFLVKTTSNLTE
jgi:hypothetical protein